MKVTNLADVYQLLIDRTDLTLEEARNVAYTCVDSLSIFRVQEDSLLSHLPLHRVVPKHSSKRKLPCTGTCGKLTTRWFPLYPHAGPLCMKCERGSDRYHTIDFTTAKRRFFLSREDLEDVPAIKRYRYENIRCRYFRPADLLGVALTRHGGRDGLRARRELGLKRRQAAMKGIERRRRCPEE